jgi:hypothetical protein
VLYPLSYEGEGRFWVGIFAGASLAGASPPTAAWRPVRIVAVAWSAGENASRRSSESSLAAHDFLLAATGRRNPATLRLPENVSIFR